MASVTWTQELLESRLRRYDTGGAYTYQHCVLSGHSQRADNTRQSQPADITRESLLADVTRESLPADVTKESLPGDVTGESWAGDVTEFFTEEFRRASSVDAVSDRVLDGLRRRGYSLAAVLILVVLRAGEPHVLLTRRAARMRAHASLIAFPGGRRSPADDRCAADTALREAAEEVGLRSENVTPLACGPPRVMSRDKLLVYPVAAVWRCSDEALQLRCSAAEVADCFALPLRRFLSAERGFTWLDVPLRDDTVHRVLTFDDLVRPFADETHPDALVYLDHHDNQNTDSNNEHVINSNNAVMNSTDWSLTAGDRGQGSPLLPERLYRTFGMTASLCVEVAACVFDQVPSDPLLRDRASGEVCDVSALLAASRDYTEERLLQLLSRDQSHRADDKTSTRTVARQADSESQSNESIIKGQSSSDLEEINPSPTSNNNTVHSGPKSLL